MLKEIYIENYKSLRNVTVQFKDGLNIIIGKNGSGKSNLLEFIGRSILSYASPDIRSGFTWGDNYYYIVKSEKEDATLQVNVETSLKPLSKSTIFDRGYVSEKTVRIELDIAGQLTKSEVHILGAKGLEGLPYDTSLLIAEYAFELRTINFDVIKDVPFLDIANKYEFYFDQLIPVLTGRNNNFHFGVYFRYFLDSKIIEGELNFNDLPEFKNDVIACFEKYKLDSQIGYYLRTYSPIQDIRLNPNINIYEIGDRCLIENLLFEFQMDGTWMPWSYLSDGTKRLFIIIAEVSSQRNGLFLLDEPELGIHPHQLYKLMQFLDEQSATKQIIISTHSPIVLDALQSSELDRIIIAKMENGASKFDSLTDKQMTDAKMYMEEVNELSYYWLHSDLEEHD